MTTGEVHDVVLAGVWHMDATAGVGLWCRTCEEWVKPDGETMLDADELDVDEATVLIAAHREETLS